MADSVAVRSRRSRLHARGDHSMCLVGRCDVARDRAAEANLDAGTAPAAVVRDAAPQELGPAGEQSGPHGPLEAMARAMVDSLPYAASDPRRMIGELAVVLGRKLDADGAAPAAVRELRTLMTQLVDVPNQPAGFVDEVRLRRASRRLDAILANVEKGMAVAFDADVELLA